jgi:hypothetical protein
VRDVRAMRFPSRRRRRKRSHYGRLGVVHARVLGRRTR